MTVSCRGRAADPEVDPHGVGRGGTTVERREGMCGGSWVSNIMITQENCAMLDDSFLTTTENSVKSQ